jgi:predicted DNA-binding transcriptional regulator YafY
MRRADRLYRITDYLRGRRLTTAQWLASRLDVSVRTIYRDIADLMAAGVPITGEAGVGYALSRRLDLPPLMFDREEIEALAVGLRFTQAYGDDALRSAAERAQSKVRGIVSRTLADHMRELPAFVTRKGDDISARLGEVLRAIEERLVLELEYHDEASRQSTRLVWPLGVLFSAQAWTLVAWCELRDDFRSFRLDRVAALAPTGARYPLQIDRTLQAFFDTMKSRYGIDATDFDPER